MKEIPEAVDQRASCLSLYAAAEDITGTGLQHQGPREHGQSVSEVRDVFRLLSCRTTVCR